MMYGLRMTEAHRRALLSHLFPGDGLEAVALLLCGRRHGKERHVFTARRVVPVPHAVCDRRPDRVTWPTEYVEALLQEAYAKGQAIVKVHSHPGHYRHFSSMDDVSDRALFSSVASFLDDGLAHASVIMLPDGDMIGRAVWEDGRISDLLKSIMAVGDDIRIFMDNSASKGPEFARRHAQAFGQGTTALLRKLSAAVVGCSGTGSIVIEQLARLGIGRLVLIDPEAVEEKNLNRILNTGMADVERNRAKVEILADAIRRIGVGQEVITLRKNLLDRKAVEAVGECDVVFGCMDSAEGRHLLNRLATFYTVPYFDVGVRLDADGKGGIDQIAGAVHYLQPGGSSLLSRGVYDLKRVEAEEMQRANPGEYQRQVKEGYLRGVEEDRPAVISVNMFYAALLVNEFLARLHVYRNQLNSDYACVSASLCEMQLYAEGENAPCEILKRHVGRGDVVPLLERPALS